MKDENIKYETGFLRFGAALIDGIVLFPLAFADLYARTHFLIYADNKLILFINVFFVTTINIFYSVYLHYKFGQTLGKWVVNVKVVNIDETRKLSFKQALLRDSFYIIIETFALIYLVFQLINSILPPNEILDNFDSFGGTVTLIWILLELISMLTNDKKRAVHDFIAGSVVIRTDLNKK